MRRRIRSILAVVLAALAVLVTVVGNLNVRPGSVIAMPNPIIGDDPIVTEHHETMRLTPFREQVRLVKRFGLKFEAAELGSSESFTRIMRFHEELEAEFPGYSVMSLANMPNFHRDADGVLVIDQAYTEYEGSLESWRKLAKSHKGVHRVFFSEDFSMVFFFLGVPRELDEVAEGRRIVQTLEGTSGKYDWVPEGLRPMAWDMHWKMLQTDINPSDEHMLAAGWVLGRLIIMSLTFVNALLINGGTVAILVPILLGWLLGNWRHGLIGLGFILASLLFQRGMIGMLYFVGFEERAYVVLANGMAIVGGISIYFHAVSRYNREGNFYLALERLRTPYLLVAVASFFGYLSLATMPVWSIVELGWLCIFSLAAQLYMAHAVLPSLFARTGIRPYELTLSTRRSKWLGNLVYYVTPARSGFSVASATAVAIFTIIAGYFLIGSAPLDFMKGRLLHRSHLALDAPGGSGFDVVEGSDQSASGDPRDPNFLREVHAKLARFAELDSSRAVGSIIWSLEHIGKIRYDKSFQELTDREIARCFRMLASSSMPDSVREQLWVPKDSGPGSGTIRFSIFADTAATPRTKVLVDAVRELGSGQEYGTQRLFGRDVIYPQLDYHIVRGKLANFVVDVGIVMVVAMFFILVSPTRRRTFSCWRFAIALATPFFFGSMVVVIVMAISGVGLDLATAAVGAFAIAAAIDFCIYPAAIFVDEMALQNPGSYDPRELIAEIMEAEGPTVLFDALINAAGFSTLALLATIGPVANLGMIMIVMLLSTCFGALVLMPSLLVWAVKRN